MGNKEQYIIKVTNEKNVSDEVQQATRNRKIWKPISKRITKETQGNYPLFAPI